MREDLNRATNSIRNDWGRIGRFFNPLIETLARWSWWRVFALSILLMITGTLLDGFFMPSPPPTKKVSKKLGDGDVKITINNGKVQVERGANTGSTKSSAPKVPEAPNTPAAPASPTSPEAAKTKPIDSSQSEQMSKSIEQLKEELESGERSLERAAEDLGRQIEAFIEKRGNVKDGDGSAARFEQNVKELQESIKKIEAAKRSTVSINLDGDLEDDDEPKPTRTEFFAPLSFLLIIAMIALKLIGGARVREQAATVRADQATASADASDLQRQVAEARLLRMQAQVEPHFLFNTLAALERLIEVNPTKALAMSQALSQWLRALLPQMKEGQSTLGQEVNLIQSYLQLMQIRMGDRLAYFVDVPEALRSQAIPSMLLQPLVENSIKHGLEPKKLGGEVRIRARKQNGMLELTVEDTGVGFAANPNTGNGLTNLRERLDLLFGGRAMVSIVPRNSLGTSGSGGPDDQALAGTTITVKLPV
jgi:exonuclease VII small subunit